VARFFRALLQSNDFPRGVDKKEFCKRLLFGKPQEVYGAVGDFVGYHSLVMHLARKDVTIVLLINSGDPAHADLVQKKVLDLLGDFSASPDVPAQGCVAL